MSRLALMPVKPPLWPAMGRSVETPKPKPYSGELSSGFGLRSVLTELSFRSFPVRRAVAKCRRSPTVE
jgi:hypothetical protein